jgi:heterodisulfide reductase subunit A
MMDVGRHPRIELLSYSEVVDVQGYVGNFQVKVRKKPRYVDETKCTGCGECVAVCPVEVPNAFEMGLGTHKAVYRSFPQAVPNVFIIDKQPSPCKVTCPAHIRVQGYIALIAQGKFDEALALIRDTVPFPAVLGRVCHHPCETECKRKEVDQVLAICSLKRFAYDTAARSDPKPEPVERTKKEKVAIVGAGPAGLTAAYDLVRKGYGVTVFEALPVAGGMLAVGIPGYRLPREVLEQEIDDIKALGVEIQLNTPIGRDGGPNLDDLRQHYDAVLLAVGAHRSRKLGVLGEELEGVIHSTDFLRRLNLVHVGVGDSLPKVGKRVVVIGGGNSAVDAARSALRLGGEVTIVYRRSRVEMPAIASEVDEAEEEGIAMHFLATPIRILGRNGRVVGMECVRMELGPPDESGRRRPIPIEGSEFTLDVDTVIISIGQQPDLSPLARMEATRWGTLAADPDTKATPLEGVFAAGDAVTGPWSAVEAIAGGKEAAKSIDRYLQGRDLREGRLFEWPQAAAIEVKIPADREQMLRQAMAKLPLVQRKTSFKEVELGFTEEQAQAEAARCFSCAICSECLQCVQACDVRCIDHEMREEILDLEVGTIILATGYDLLDMSLLPQYGYGVYDNVIDGLQFERLSSAAGPTDGRILTKDGREPEAIAILHCIGSRDDEVGEHCSRICCMYALKQAHLARDKTGGKVYEFYIDMRTAGKGYEEFYKRIQEEGVYFIRGKAAEIEPENGRLLVRAEDTLLGRPVEVAVDMVVLATGARPARGAQEIARLFSVSQGKEGFFTEAHPKLRPVDTTTDGVFLAGCCQGPKDIPDTVAQASAAASRALILLSQGEVEIEPVTAEVIAERCSGCGECVLSCAYSAITVEDGKAVVNAALCKGCGTCAGACLAKAIVLHHFTDEELVAELEGIFSAMPAYERVVA